MKSAEERQVFGARQVVERQTAQAHVESPVAERQHARVGLNHADRRIGRRRLLGQARGDGMAVHRNDADRHSTAPPPPDHGLGDIRAPGRHVEEHERPRGELPRLPDRQDLIQIGPDDRVAPEDSVDPAEVAQGIPQLPVGSGRIVHQFVRGHPPWRVHWDFIIAMGVQHPGNAARPAGAIPCMGRAILEKDVTDVLYQSFTQYPYVMRLLTFRSST